MSASGDVSGPSRVVSCMTASVECLDAVAEHRVELFAHAFVCMADFAGMFAGSFVFARSAMRMRAVRVSSLLLQNDIWVGSGTFPLFRAEKSNPEDVRCDTWVAKKITIWLHSYQNRYQPVPVSRVRR